jgi:restriction system protein
MSRYGKNNDPLPGIILISGLLLCLSVISPAKHRFSNSFLEIIIFAAAVVIFVCSVVFILKRKLRQHAADEFLDSDTNSPANADYLPIPSIETTEELIKLLRRIDWFQFEKVVELLYWKRGYNVSRRGGANPDGGIDLVVERNGWMAAIQCKQWKTWNVGVKSVREFLGALTDSKIQNGIFITLNGYTGEAKQLAEKHGIEIINESGLATMLEEADLRTHPEMLKILNDTRKLCPKCESEMVLRTASKGPNAGQQFWGCSAYPKCRFTMQLKGG